LHAQRGQQLPTRSTLAADIQAGPAEGKPDAHAPMFGAEPPQIGQDAWFEAPVTCRCQRVVDHLDGRKGTGRPVVRRVRRRLARPCPRVDGRGAAARAAGRSDRLEKCRLAWRGSRRRTSRHRPLGSKNTDVALDLLQQLVDPPTRPTSSRAPTDSAPRRRRPPGNVEVRVVPLLLFLVAPCSHPAGTSPPEKRSSCTASCGGGCFGSRGCDTTDTAGTAFEERCAQAWTVVHARPRTLGRWCPSQCPVLGSRDDLVLQRLRQVAEVVAVARDPDDEIWYFSAGLRGPSVSAVTT